MALPDWATVKALSWEANEANEANSRAPWREHVDDRARHSTGRCPRSETRARVGTRQEWMDGAWIGNGGGQMAGSSSSERGGRRCVRSGLPSLLIFPIRPGACRDFWPLHSGLRTWTCLCLLGRRLRISFSFVARSSPLVCLPTAPQTSRSRTGCFHAAWTEAPDCDLYLLSTLLPSGSRFPRL